ncbi:MAG: class I SAM-dependent methyltransferase [Magnetococcales bacterium]|nr:class I SAM-dependent methyltransferase [Magnetococcales bacterium]
MSLLYPGQYRARFAAVTSCLHPEERSVLELCFGDVILARYCLNSNRRWTGFDINDSFVRHAKKLGFDAYCVDILNKLELPSSDVCIMMGSLYHFHENLPFIFRNILTATPRLLLMEPVENFSSRPGVIGALARLSASVGKGDEAFRFTRTSLTDRMDELSRQLGFSWRIISAQGRQILLEIHR